MEQAVRVFQHAGGKRVARFLRAGEFAAEMVPEPLGLLEPIEGEMADQVQRAESHRGSLARSHGTTQVILDESVWKERGARFQRACLPRHVGNVPNILPVVLS